jgi:hypothetical protein
MKIALSISILALLLLSCDKKTDLEKQITIKVNSVDKETKQPRVNMFDTVIIKEEGNGYLTKAFYKVGEYTTDPAGVVKIKIDPSRINDISVSGLNIYGGDMYYPGHLKDGQEINLEVRSLNNN